MVNVMAVDDTPWPGHGECRGQCPAETRPVRVEGNGRWRRQGGGGGPVGGGEGGPRGVTRVEGRGEPVEGGVFLGSGLHHPAGDQRPVESGAVTIYEVVYAVKADTRGEGGGVVFRP